MSNSQKIFIYGAPGAGKTTFSIELEKKLGYPLVEGDYLREVVAQKEKTETEDPFVYVGTKEAFRKFGPLTEENVIKGLKAVRNSMASYVEKEIAKHPDTLILEAAFLDPLKINKFGKLILVVTSDEERHRKQYFEHRPQNENHIETFKAARMIQDYLQKEAKGFAITTVENDGDMSAIIKKINF